MFCTNNRININPHNVSFPLVLAGNYLFRLIISWYKLCSCLLYDEGNFCQIWASLRLLLFYICFRSLLINMRLVFISYLVSVPLRKGYRDLEYKCSFVRLYLFLLAFLIICIKSFGFCLLIFLHFWLFTLKLLVFVDCFVTNLNKTMT